MITIKQLMLMRALKVAGGSAWATIKGIIAHFVDGTASPLRSLIADIDPVQSGSGDPSPDNIRPISGHTGVNVYVRGGNLCDGAAYHGQLTSGKVYLRSTTPITSPFITTTAWQGAGFIAPVKSGQTYALSSDVTGDTTTFYWCVYKSIADMTNVSNVVQSGTTGVSFTSNHDGYVVFMRYNQTSGTTMEWTYAQVELGSTATAYHAYTGQDYEVQFPALGKNIIPPNYSSTTVNGVTFTVNGDGTIVANGLASADADFMIISAANIDPLLTSGQSYTFSGCPSGGSASTYCTRFNVMGKFDYGSGESFTYSGGTPGNFSIRIYSGYNAQNLVFKPMVCLSSAPNPTVFEPYNTVYSGTLDVVSGELVVTEKVVDLGTLDWSKNNNGSFYANIDAKKDGVNPMMCENYGYVANKGYGVTNGTVSDSNSVAKRIFIRDDNYSDKDTFKAAMSGVQLLCPLATPITYQLTPTEVNSLLGVNNIWTDTGQVEVTYKKA